MGGKADVAKISSKEQLELTDIVPILETGLDFVEVKFGHLSITENGYSILSAASPGNKKHIQHAGTISLSVAELQSESKSSFYPLLKPITSPGTNPIPTARGNPENALSEECIANCDAVSLSACTICPSTVDNVVIVAFSISNHFTSIHPLYDRYASPATNNPTTTAAYFHDLLNGIASNCSKQEAPTSRKYKVLK